MVEEFGHYCELQNGLANRHLINTENLPGPRKRISRRKRSLRGTNDDINPNEVNTPREFFWQYFPVPLDRAPAKLLWLQNPRLNHITNYKPEFENDTDIFEREIFIYSIQQLYEKLENGSPLFSMLHVTDIKYENRVESTNNLGYFLEYQLKQQKEQFIEFLWDLLNHKSGKFNCLNIIGPASSGKTFFVRTIKEAMITSGLIANITRNSQFPFNNCINKRLLHWDEPNFEPAATEQLKQLFSGDELSVNVKYSPYQTIQRTPVIVTANANVFPMNEAFNCRIQHFNFLQAPFLKTWKQFHPMSIYDMFKKRNFLE